MVAHEASTSTECMYTFLGSGYVAGDDPSRAAALSSASADRGVNRRIRFISGPRDI